MNCWIIGAAVIVAVIALMVTTTLRIYRNPLQAIAKASRRALQGKGYKQVRIDTPVGPQAAFIGGSGPLLLLLHGEGDQAGIWSRVAASLAKGATVIIPDLPGHGDSAPAGGPIETGTVYAGLEAVLADVRADRRAILVGHGLGAWMAMLLAQRHPDWVERVIAVNGGALAADASPVSLLPATREEARRLVAMQRDPSSPPLPANILEDMVRHRATGSLARFEAAAASRTGWFLDEDQLRGFPVPVRLLWGASDQVLPTAHAERLKALLPGADLSLLDRCGHTPHQEAPDRFLEALERALPAT